MSADKDIFFEALDLPTAEERRPFVERSTTDDSQRARIGRLLANHFKDDAFLAASVATDLDLVGQMIGPYKILERLGEGGCGVVYVAEQTAPIRRRVALKVIKAGMDTHAVIARFEAERQAIALMDHPNIAKVLDAGATDKGRPFFVMELVRGVRITDFCDENSLTPAQRLDLFAKVCGAIQHAHQKGIIHRDIKPSNILVTTQDGAAIPKVIDFGIAKAIEGRLTDATVYTRLQQFIGTPAYMSPEQAEMTSADIDTRSDIYSLGVLLYELLAAAPPFNGQELIDAGLDAMRKTIREKEPLRPSARLGALNAEAQTTAAQRRGSSAPQLIHFLKGDLDWIVMKCLEKDRSRRYETASNLAADIQRHLSNEPILARPPSALYKFQKFAARNKASVAFGLAIVAILIVAFVATALSYRREKVTRALAEAEALRARQFQYASDMNLANQAIDEGNLFRGLQLLNRHKPASAGAPNDLRGWEWRYLMGRCQSDELATVGKHDAEVQAVGFLPDGQTAFSGGNDKIVRFWDLRSRLQVGALTNNFKINGAACSPDARWLAVSGEDKNDPLVLWNLATRQASELPLTNRFNWIRERSLVFSPDSKLLAYALVNGGVQILSLDSQKTAVSLPAYHQWLRPWGMNFSPDGRRFAFTEDGFGTIAIWDLQQQSIVKRWKGHTAPVTSLAFTPDGGTMITSSADRSVKLWDAEGLARATFTNYQTQVPWLQLSPDGTHFATAASGAGGTITVQELPSGSATAKLRGHTSSVTDGAFSPDNRTFLSGSLDGTVRLWDVTASPEKNDPDRRAMPDGIGEFFNGTASSFVFSRDGRHLLIAFTNRTFSVWEFPQLRESARRPIPTGNIDSGTMALADGGNLAAFTGRDGMVALWRADTGETNHFAGPFTNRFTRAAFSPDSQRLALGSVFGAVVFDLADRREIFRAAVSGQGSAFSLRFSPDGQKLVAGFFGGLVKTWDLANGGREQTLRGHDQQVPDVAILPDNQTVVTMARDVRFWPLSPAGGTNAPNPSEILQPRPALFRCAAITPDGGRLAVGGGDGLITIWDLASRQEVLTLNAHTRGVQKLAFLPDGESLVSVGLESIRLWRAPVK